ncbi:MAG: hypothetical protein N2654_05725 [Deltaproteobacteria bacterium]|nr:hypothetical protein [Deltaproteobacteria bacterium]
MQKVKDLVTKIREDKRLLFAVLALVLVSAIVLLLLPDGNQNARKKRKTEPKDLAFTQSTQGREVYKDLLERFTADLEKLSEATQKTQQELEQQKQILQEHQERTKEIFTKLVEKIAEQQNKQNQQTSVGGQSLGGEVKPIPELQKSEMEKFMKEESVQPVSMPIQPRRSAVINAGDAVKVELLSGVNAPVDGSPYPVVFRVIGDIYGPNNTTLPVGEARILAAAQGSLIDQRVLFRLTSMTISLPDGSRKELKVDGWVVGEDGIRGLPGILIDPLSEKILGAGIAEGVRGFGEGFEVARRKRVTVFDYFGEITEEFSGSPLELGAARALQGMAGVYSDAVRQRANLLTPVVQVYAGRQATAVFSKSVEVGDELLAHLEEEMETGYGSIFD